MEGSPYFEDQFLPGIIYEDGGNSQNAYFRYNVADDQVEVKVSPSQKEIFVLPRQEKFIYKLKDYSYVLGSYNVYDVGLIKGFVNRYFQDENIVFIGKPFAKISEAQAAKTSYEKTTPATINIGTAYYLGINGEQLKEVKLKEKDFKNIFGSSKEMKKYFDEHKIKETQDVVEMLKFYATLGK